MLSKIYITLFRRVRTLNPLLSKGFGILFVPHQRRRRHKGIIDLLTQGGAAMNAPVAFTCAADNATNNFSTYLGLLYSGILSAEGRSYG